MGHDARWHEGGRPTIDAEEPTHSTTAPPEALAPSPRPQVSGAIVASPARGAAEPAGARPRCPPRAPSKRANGAKGTKGGSSVCGIAKPSRLSAPRAHRRGAGKGSA